jgi:hypothetical protein
MKRAFILFTVFAIIGLYAFVVSDHNIVGHWTASGPDYSNVFVDFNSDSTFKVTSDGQTENEGRYKFYEDTFVMYDNNCGMQTGGKYKITFYNDDSASFKLIEDSCSNRAQEVDGGTIKRLSGN